MVLARILLTLLALGQAVGTVLIDGNRTHATNPRWPGHARFHLVWQMASTVLLSGCVIGMVWWRGDAGVLLFYVAAGVLAMPLLGFVVALVSRGTYAGTLSDPNGIPAPRVHFAGRTRSMDGNTWAVMLALVVLGVAVLVFRHGAGF